ncbi:MAG TPA: hypothetical protein VG734_24965 [Lacunisphaera sp.]|nr:hypothetical protein [Lacunisphaera sp.]
MDSEGMMVPSIDWGRDARIQREYRDRQNEQMRQIMMGYYVLLMEYGDQVGNKDIVREGALGTIALLKGTPGFIAADMIATLGAGPAGAAERGMLRGGAGLASTIGGEAMDAALFARIKAAFERNGGKILQGSEVDGYLTYRGAEGLTDNAVQVLLRSAPGRSAVFEELIHTAQHRTGRYAAWVEKYGNAGAEVMAEIEAGRKLIRFQGALGLPSAEAAATAARLEGYIQQAKALGLPH